MRILKNLLASSLVLSSLNTPLSTSNIPPIELIVKESQKPQKVVKENWNAISIDLGNLEDQRVFINYFKKNYHNSTYKFNGDYFPIPWTLEDYTEGNSTKINEYALENSKRLDKILKDARIIHFSGHHYATDDFFFSRIDFKDNVYIWSAVNLTNLSVHDDVEIIFLNSCNTVHKFRRFTINLKKVFPNAILLGYDSKSAYGTVNARLLERFFNSLKSKNIFDIPKRELGELWINAGKDIYSKRKDRGLRALWSENNQVYELSSLNYQ